MKSLFAALFRHPSGRIGLFIIGLYLLAAILGTAGFTPYDPLKLFAIDRLKAPNATYWFGTDLLGRDSFSRLMVGIRQSMIIAFAAVAIATLAGTVIGLLSAWWGGIWDGIFMRVMDVLLAFPAILLALLIIAIVGPGTATSVARRKPTPSTARRTSSASAVVAAPPSALAVSP